MSIANNCPIHSIIFYLLVYLPTNMNFLTGVIAGFLFAAFLCVQLYTLVHILSTLYFILFLFGSLFFCLMEETCIKNGLTLTPATFLAHETTLYTAGFFQFFRRYHCPISHYHTSVTRVRAHAR